MIKTTSKKTSRATRVWIEGSKLEAAGWGCGTRFAIEVEEDAGRENWITLWKIASPDFLLGVPEGKVSDGSRGGKPRPIIDLHSKMVEKVFPAGTEVTVFIHPDRIEYYQEAK